jgi:Fe-S cluster biogenesis protein NfuA
MTEPGDAAERATPAPARLDNRAVRALLAVLDEQLAQLEATPGPVGELALTAVSGLAEVYGQALARTLDLADPDVVERMLGDELIGHLLALHGVHPEPVEARVARVIEGLRSDLSARGGAIELDGFDRAVPIVRVSLAGCGSSAADVELAVRRAVLTAAPELAGVTIVPAGRASSAPFVSLDALMRTATSTRPR